MATNPATNRPADRVLRPAFTAGKKRRFQPLPDDPCRMSSRYASSPSVAVETSALNRKNDRSERGCPVREGEADMPQVIQKIAPSEQETSPPYAQTMG